MTKIKLNETRMQNLDWEELLFLGAKLYSGPTLDLKRKPLMTEYLVQGTLYSTSAFRNTLGPKEEYQEEDNKVYEK